MNVGTLFNANLLAGIIGVASHLFSFRVGEHHMLAAVYVQLFSLACTSGTIALVKIAHIPITSALTTTLALSSSWLFGVYGSLLIYRLFFQPLKKFPGPWQARFGDLWLSYHLTGFKAYSILHDLHQKNGRYVRVGSNTLSITDPDIMQSTYGPHAQVTKSDWYDAAYPHHSMQSVRDKAVHDRRRRIWAPAFSDKALREYESTIAEINRNLIRRIDSFKGGPVNVQRWFNLYSFDVMGRLAFGKDYEMVTSGERHWALDILTEGTKLGGLKLPTWIIRLLLAIPGAAAGHHKFFRFCTEELKWRIARAKQSTDDITGWLLKAYGDEKNPGDDPMLQGDSRLIIIAGSDTTAAALTYLFYHLAQNPTQQQRLREELRRLTSQKDWTDKDIKHSELLNGAINEALRLHPPVSSGLMRKSPPEGMQVGEVFVAGNTTFYTPQYAMGRDKRSYVQPNNFIPERWYSRPGLILHADAFAPFSMGPFGCIGQNLARMEIRTLSALLLLKYSIEFAPGEDGQKVLSETRDHFTLTPGPLQLAFTSIDD